MLTRNPHSPGTFHHMHIAFPHSMCSPQNQDLDADLLPKATPPRAPEGCSSRVKLMRAASGQHTSCRHNS